MILQIFLAKPEPSNVRDKSVVAVFKKMDQLFVGHVPINMAPILYQFLRKEVSKAFVEIKGENMNRGGGNTVCLSSIQLAMVYTKIERYS